MLTPAVKRELRSRLELLIPTLIDDEPSPIIELIFSFFALAPVDPNGDLNEQTDKYVDYQIRDKLARYFNDQTQTFAQEFFGILHDIRSNQPIPDRSNKQISNQSNSQTDSQALNLTDDSSDTFDIYGDAPLTLKRKHDEIEDEPTSGQSSDYQSTAQFNSQSSVPEEAPAADQSIDHSIDLDGDSRRQRSADHLSPNQSNSQASYNPPTNQSYNQSSNQLNNPANKRQRNDVRGVCFDFQRTGQCRRGTNCRFDHAPPTNQPHNQPRRNDQYNGQQQQAYQPPQQAGYKSTYVNNSSSNQSSHQSSNKLLITDIPPEFYKLSLLTQHFSLFGEISGIQLLGDGRSEVSFDDGKSALAAYQHPKAVFDNRFIKVLWADQGNTQMSNQASNQSHHRPNTQSYNRSNSEHQPRFEPPAAVAPPPARSAIEVARAIAQSKAGAQVEELSNLDHPHIAHANPSPPRSALEVAAMLKAKQAQNRVQVADRPADQLAESSSSTLTLSVPPPSSQSSTQSSDDSLRPITPINSSPTPSAGPSALEVAKTLKMNQLKKLMSQYEDVKERLRAPALDDETRASLDAQAVKLKSEIAQGLATPSAPSPVNNQSAYSRSPGLDEALSSSSYRGRGGRGFARGRGRGASEHYGRGRGRGYSYE